MTVNIGQSEVTTGMVVSKSFMVEAKAVQNCGLQVVDVDRILDNVKSEVVRPAD